MNTEYNEHNEKENSEIQVMIDENSSATKKWKNIVIGVLCILTLFTVWAGYLIINGSLTYITNPLSINILDDVAILCILWFVGVFIALAHRLGILGFGKKEVKEDTLPATDAETEPEEENKSKLKKYLFPGLTILVVIPVISAVVLYYIIYFIVFLFLGILPYLVGVGMITGLIISIIRLSRMVYKPKRAKKIMTYSTLMILAYAFVIFMMYEFDSKTKGNQPSPGIDQQEVRDSTLVNQ